MIVDQDERTLPADEPVVPRGHRRWSWLPWAATAAGYAVATVLTHCLHPWLPEMTLATYGVADVGGLAFILRYIHTDWRAHAWGRHVMAFMVCLEIIFTLAVSRRLFGDWLGLEETLFLSSLTFAGIVWWRYALQAQGDRRAQQLRTRRYGAADGSDLDA